MPTLLKSFFDRRSQPTPQEAEAMDSARLALQTRLDQMLRHDAARTAATKQPSTDAYGRAIH